MSNNSYLNKLGNFNKIIAFYKNILRFTENIKPNMISNVQYGRYEDVEEVFVLAARAICNNVALVVSQMNEISNLNEKEWLDLAFEDIASFKELIISNSERNKEGNMLQEEDKKQQIKNCLAHADYKINVENAIKNTGKNIEYDFSKVFIEIDNGKIKGRIPFEDILRLPYIYHDIHALYSGRKQNKCLISKIDISKCISKEKLNKHISSLKMLIIEGKKNENVENHNIKEAIESIGIIKTKNEYMALFECMTNMVKFANVNEFSLKIEPVEEEQKKFVENYYKYIGLGNLDKMCDYTRTMVSENVFAASMQNIIATGLSEELVACFIELHTKAYSKKEFDKMQQGMQAISYQGPIAYSNMLLGLSYYCFNYVREVNLQNKKEEKNFLYKDIQIKGKYELLGNTEEKLIKKKNSMQEVIDEKNLKEKDLRKVLQAIRTKIKYNNVKNKDPKKKEILESIQQQLDEYDNLDSILENLCKKATCDETNKASEEFIYDNIKKLINGEYDSNSLTEEQKAVNKKFMECLENYISNNQNSYPMEDLDSEILKLSQRIAKDNYEYEDSSNFFRHLRNSLSHGNYKIQFNKALEKKRLDKIMFHFEDFDEKENTLFKLDITAKQLLDMLEQFKNSVNAQAKEGKRITNIDLIETGFLTDQDKVNSLEFDSQIRNEINNEEQSITIE